MSSAVDGTVTPAELDRMYDRLLPRDPVLRRLADRYGRPDPFVWAGGGRTDDSNFAALVLHVVGQQISTRVALVLFGRVEAAAGGRLRPDTIAPLGVGGLRALGLSSAKAAAIAGLAEMHSSGTLDVDRLADLDDEQATRALTAARGVGPWTAQMFLIHQLRRPDVLPAGDLGIRQAVQRAWGLAELPTVQEVQDRGEAWSPERTVAAALLWSSLRPVEA